MKRKGIKYVEIGEYLVVDPRICHGQLTFKGTRVPVSTVLAYLAKGWTLEQVVASWPDVRREAVTEAIRLAAAALVEKATGRPKGTPSKPRSVGVKAQEPKPPRSSTKAG
jgi:uncharacterized protein (DUF433 family)